MSCTEQYTPTLLIDNIKMTMSCQETLRLPAAANFVFRLERELHKLDNTLEHVIKVLEEKPLLVSRILKYFNSDDFKDKVRKYPSYQIETLERAIKAYGIKYVQRFALSYILDGIDFNQRLIKEIINSGLTCALCCSEITCFVSNVKRDAAYMYGLVKDYGHVALAYKYSDSYRRILDMNRTDPLQAFKTIENELQINITFVHVALATTFGIGLKRDDNTDWIDERSILLAAQEQFSPNFVCIEQEAVRKLIAIGYIGTVISNHIHGQASSASLLNSFEQAKQFLDLSEKQIKEVEENVRKHLHEE